MGKGRGVSEHVAQVRASVDLDDLFAYQTLHYTTIRDRRLGLLSLGFKIGIVFYIIYQLFGEGGYLRMNEAEGSARFSLRNPTSNCTYAERQAGEGKGGLPCAPCDPLHTFPCYDAFPNVTSLRYCAQSPLPYTKGRKKLTCKFKENAASQTVFQESILVVTSGTEVEENQACSVDPADPLYQGGVCDNLYNVNASSVSEYYHGDIEDFTVEVHHSLSHPQQVAAGALRVGRLLVEVDEFDRARTDDLCKARGETSGGARASVAPCYIRADRDEGGADSLLFNDILVAAHVSLDKVVSRVGGVSTVRDVGTTIVLRIEYSNWSPWKFITGVVRPTYQYIPQAVYNNSFQNQLAIYSEYPTARSVVFQNGVNIVAEQSGKVADFDFTTMLITLTTSLTILAVATKITDILATTVLPGSELYTDFINNKTPDMSDVREGLICSTCNRPLIPVCAGAQSSGLMTRNCGQCEVTMEDGEAMYLCTHCDIQRCPLCLTTSTINKPPSLPVHALARSLFGTALHEGERKQLTYHDLVRMYETLKITELIGAKSPTWAVLPAEEDYYGEWLHHRIEEERDEVQSKWQALLLRYSYSLKVGDGRHNDIRPLWVMSDEEKDEYREELKQRFEVRKDKEAQERRASASNADAYTPLVNESEMDYSTGGV